MKELLFVMLGFVLSFVPPWFDRKRKLKTHWHALHAELILIKGRAETLIKDQIRAPLYRLPVIAYETSFPILLSEGVVAEDELIKIGLCFSQVQDINRGLDNASAMYHSDSKKLEQEYERNCLKTQALISGSSGKESLLAPAMTIIESKIKLSFWRY